MSVRQHLSASYYVLLTVSSLSGLVGLSLSYSLSITMLLSGLIFSFTQTEMQLVSVERTEEYSTGLPTEPQDQNTQVRSADPDIDRSTAAAEHRGSSGE